jgi:polysaccharide export outer membrane protein
MKGEKGIKPMTWLSLFSLFFLCCLAGCSHSRKLEIPDQVPQSQAMTDTVTMSPYILEVGDEVSIKVWGFDDLQKSSLVINNSGEIYCPLVGQVKLAGLTVPKAHDLITKRLKEYIVDPQIDFTTSTNRQQVYIFGEVNNPGIINYRRPLMVAEAIAKAGWFNHDANRKRVLLIRRAHNQYNVFSVGTGDLFQDGSRVQEFYLQGGDYIYVSPKGIVKVERFLQHVQTLTQPFLTVEQAVVLWPQFFDALQGKTSSTGLAIGTSSGTGSNTSSSTTTTTSSTNSTSSTSKTTNSTTGN